MKDNNIEMAASTLKLYASLHKTTNINHMSLAHLGRTFSLLKCESH